MKPSAILMVALAIPTVSLAEQGYNSEYFDNLVSLRLESQAFQYAIDWAGNGSADAAVDVAYALLDGIGVGQDPMAALWFVCQHPKINEFELGKIVIRANLGLVGQVDAPVRCEDLMRQQEKTD